MWNNDAASVVVGVVSNTHDGSLAGGFGDEVYLPMTPAREQPVMYVLLRTRASTSEAAAGLRRVVEKVDPLVPVTRVRSLNEVVSASVSAPRSLAILLLSFGALALLIGGVGVYSLIAYVVSWRTREIGIRLALGAMRWQIVGAIVKQSLLLAVGGSVAGLVAAALLDAVFAQFPFRRQRAGSAHLLCGARRDAPAGSLRGVGTGAQSGRCGSDGDPEKRIERPSVHAREKQQVPPQRTYCLAVILRMVLVVLTPFTVGTISTRPPQVVISSAPTMVDVV